MLEKCVLTILELNWNQHSSHKKTKLNICHYMLTSSTQLQNRSFHVVERTRTSSKCQKIKNARAKRAKKYCFSLSNMQICGVFVTAVVVVAYKLPYRRIFVYTFCLINICLSLSDDANKIKTLNIERA